MFGGSTGTPFSQSFKAYRYLLDFDPRVASCANLLKEPPGVGNVTFDRAGPEFMQDIFNKLPPPMKTCLKGIASFARLHLISCVAGSGLGISGVGRWRHKRRNYSRRRI
ncbi:hypothetical protein FVEN_g10951 [Fusarium venenatum]|nr:hypothetical protein FVEN_g10951 [Fusarium venenatum]